MRQQRSKFELCLKPWPFIFILNVESYAYNTVQIEVGFASKRLRRFKRKIKELKRGEEDGNHCK